MTKKLLIVAIVLCVPVFLALIAARPVECRYGPEDCAALMSETATPTLARTQKPRYLPATATPTQTAAAMQTPQIQAQGGGETISDCPPDTYPTATLSECQIATVMTNYFNTMATAWSIKRHAAETAAAMPVPTFAAQPTDGYPGGGWGYPAP